MRYDKDSEPAQNLGLREVLDTAQCAQLVDLWVRRHSLCALEIGKMYDLVSRSLQRCNPPELNLLGEGRQELIAQFIYTKVLRLHERDQASVVPHNNAVTDDGHSAPSSSFALCAYFRRYLIDCTRASAFRRKVSIGEQITPEQLEQHLDVEEGIDSCLSDYGLSPQSVSSAAIAFIDQLDAPERLLLCESFGREAEGGLSAVASRHTISSYHYRAGRLGLVHKRQSLCSDYAKTQLGGWIEKKLGIPIHVENMKAILSVFKILGSVAAAVNV